MKLGSGLGVQEVIAPKRDALLSLAKKHTAKRLWVFGSVCRREARPDSDVDLMVEWTGGHSLLHRLGLAADIGELPGRKVDLVNKDGLHWAVDARVMSEVLAV